MIIDFNMSNVGNSDGVIIDDEGCLIQNINNNNSESEYDLRTGLLLKMRLIKLRRMSEADHTRESDSGIDSSDFNIKINNSGRPKRGRKTKYGNLSREQRK